MQKKFATQLKHLLPKSVEADIEKWLSQYESRLKKVVSELEGKTFDAKQKGKKQIDLLSQEIKKRKINIEKQVSKLLNQETDKITKQLEKLALYLQKLSFVEKEAVVSTKVPDKGTPKKRPSSKSPSRKPRVSKPAISK